MLRKNFAPVLLVSLVLLTSACAKEQTRFIERPATATENGTQIENAVLIEHGDELQLNLMVMTLGFTSPLIPPIVVSLTLTDLAPVTEPGQPTQAHPKALVKPLAVNDQAPAKFGHHFAPDTLVHDYKFWIPARRINAIAKQWGVDLAQGDPLFLMYEVSVLGIYSKTFAINLTDTLTRPPTSDGEAHDKLMAAITGDSRLTALRQTTLQKILTDEEVRSYQLVDSKICTVPCATGEIVLLNNQVQLIKNSNKL